MQSAWRNEARYASKHSESGLSYKLEDGPEALALYMLTAPFAVILHNYTLPVPAIAAESGYKMAVLVRNNKLNNGAVFVLCYSCISDSFSVFMAVLCTKCCYNKG